MSTIHRSLARDSEPQVGRQALRRVLADPSVDIRRLIRRERNIADLQAERDWHLAEGRLRRGAELTTWIDELSAELSLLKLR